MSNDLTKIDSALGDLVPKGSSEVLAQVAKTGDYLGYIKLMTSRSNEVESGEFPANHYAFIMDQKLEDVGEEVDCLFFDFRARAMHMDGEDIIVSYDMNDDMFQKIQHDADNIPNNANDMYGPEFLLWIPSLKRFVTFWCASKSARRIAKNDIAQYCKLQGGAGAATLTSKVIKTAKYTWRAPDIKPCNTPFDLPEPEEIRKVVTEFQNPPKSEVDKADEVRER